VRTLAAATLASVCLVANVAPAHRYLKFIAQTHSTAKSLVFSQWGDLLRMIGSALQANGISYKRLTGNKDSAVDSFSNSPDTRVLLLDMVRQGSGLNLIAASHVFLMEPTLNPAIELQAIARVHRLGQTKNTVVHKVLCTQRAKVIIHP